MLHVDTGGLPITVGLKQDFNTETFQKVSDVQIVSTFHERDRVRPLF